MQPSAQLFTIDDSKATTMDDQFGAIVEFCSIMALWCSQFSTMVLMDGLSLKKVSIGLNVKGFWNIESQSISSLFQDMLSGLGNTLVSIPAPWTSSSLLTHIISLVTSTTFGGAWISDQDPKKNNVIDLCLCTQHVHKTHKTPMSLIATFFFVLNLIPL